MRLPRRDFVGATAVVTGAASGMGEAMAHELATEGADVLVLVDWHAERLGLPRQSATAHPMSRSTRTSSTLATARTWTPWSPTSGGHTTTSTCSSTMPASPCSAGSRR